MILSILVFGIILLDDLCLLTLIWQINNASMNFRGGNMLNVNSVIFTMLTLKFWFRIYRWKTFFQLHSMLFEQLWGHPVHSGWAQKTRSGALPERNREICSRSKIDKIPMSKATTCLKSWPYEKEYLNLVLKWLWYWFCIDKCTAFFS